ncbi:putative sialidase-like protein [Rosellinia necatrix]|uniref:Putative sialidase-like protein n=1 Tax=Rosellinia necatrix TaxID=77044 RepID=A0A1W2TXN9_ROSNE|nr:putative sialidase-like protein [Rosellinia necatrix]
MSSIAVYFRLAAGMSFDFTFPSCEPATPPSYSFDPSLFEISYNPEHARTSSYGSVSPSGSSPSDSVSTRVTTPARSPPPIRQHGPVLLPKIRSQDQTIESPAKRMKRSTTTPAARPMRQRNVRPAHTRSFTNPEALSFDSSFFSPAQDQTAFPSSLLCSPISFSQDAIEPRRASSVGLDSATLERFGFPTYRQMPSYIPAVSQSQPQPEQFMYDFSPRDTSPFSLASTPDPTPSTTLMNYLTTPNPAPSLVRSISYPLRDPNLKYSWWDVRQVRQWSTFNLDTILSLPGASALLNCPVPASMFPQFPTNARHPETEAALHNIYASYYIPKLNSALSVSSQRALQFSVPSTKSQSATSPDHLIVANMTGESSTAAAIFGGKPTARVVGLVKSFDRFNTGMRVEDNIKRIEYLRGLAHLHHVMREHSTRYGFILTEIELVLVRNGAEGTPHFGYLEVTRVQLASPEASDDDEGTPLTACLALWGLCMIAGDEPVPGQARWKAEIGAPAEGTRRKVLPRDSWIPQPQVAEKRVVKTARGWVEPDDPVCRKELGKRGVRYSRC